MPRLLMESAFVDLILLTEEVVFVDVMMDTNGREIMVLEVLVV